MGNVPKKTGTLFYFIVIDLVNDGQLAYFSSGRAPGTLPMIKVATTLRMLSCGVPLFIRAAGANVSIDRLDSSDNRCARDSLVTVAQFEEHPYGTFSQ